MRNIFNEKVIVLLTLLNAACTTVHVNPPLPMAMSPRVGNSDRVNMRVGVEPALEVSADGMYSRPPNITTDAHGAINQTVEVGYAKNFSEFTGGVYPGSNAQSIGTWIQGKFQLLGPQGIIESSDIWVSLHTRYGFQSATRSGDQKVVFGGGGYPWAGKVEVNFLTGGLSFGKSFNKWLFYLGAGYMDLPVRVRSDQARADDNSDPGGSYTKEFNGLAFSTGFGIEFMFSERRSVGISVNYCEFEVGAKRDYMVPVSLFVKVM